MILIMKIPVNDYKMAELTILCIKWTLCQLNHKVKEQQIIKIGKKLANKKHSKLLRNIILQCEFTFIIIYYYLFNF